MDTLVSVHTAVPGGAANELAANDDFPPGAPMLPAACTATQDALVDVAVSAGQNLFIRVARAGGPSGGFTLTIEPPPLANDDSSGAALIGPGTQLGDPAGATPDGSSTNFVGVNDVWYQLNAGVSGTLRVDTCGSFSAGTDTIWSLERVSDGAELAENDDALFVDPLVSTQAGPASNACVGVPGASPFDSAAAIAVNAGDQVRIRVGHFPGSTAADFVLNVPGPGDPAVSLVGRDVPLLDPVFSNYFPPGASLDLFWGSTASTCVASEGWLGGRSPLPGQQETVFAGADDTTFVLTCSEGIAQSSDSVTVRVDPIAPNDLCLNALSLDPPASDSRSAFFAGLELPGEVLPSCVANDSASVWYLVTPNQSGPLALSTLNSNYDTVLSVHDPAVCTGPAIDSHAATTLVRQRSHARSSRRPQVSHSSCVLRRSATLRRADSSRSPTSSCSMRCSSCRLRTTIVRTRPSSAILR